MSTDPQTRTREYQNLVKTPYKHWTQFEMDLITCIRDLHPVLYKKSGDWTKFQRGPLRKKAWKEIERKFTDLPGIYIRRTWQTIVENFINLKTNPAQSASKFSDGTLNFLEKDIESIIEFQNKQGTNSESTSFADSDIRQLLHEEIDISDDENIDIKFEQENNEEDDYAKSLEDNIILPGVDNATEATNETVPGEKLVESRKKWDEKELLNSTRLTKEMIEELIHIKAKQYFSAPLITNH